jgi:hypothetical protein
VGGRVYKENCEDFRVSFNYPERVQRLMTRAIKNTASDVSVGEKFRLKICSLLNAYTFLIVKCTVQYYLLTTLFKQHLNLIFKKI